MKIDTLTKIKILSLKAVTGFLCAFFPLYIAQYLSYHLFMFPMDLIIGIILLIPFFFLAKFLWKTIDSYYLLMLFEKVSKEVNEIEKNLLSDYGEDDFDTHSNKYDDNNKENIIEPTLNTLEFKIDAQYNNLIQSIPGFSTLNLNPRDRHIALNERYYLLEEAHNDIKTSEEKNALSNFREYYSKYNQFIESRIQLKKAIDKSTTSTTELKQDFISITQKINYIDSQILQLENSQEITNIINRVFVTLSGKTKDQLSTIEIDQVHKKMEETGLIKNFRQRYLEEVD